MLNFLHVAGFPRLHHKYENQGHPLTSTNVFIFFSTSLYHQHSNQWLLHRQQHKPPSWSYSTLQTHIVGGNIMEAICPEFMKN